MKVSLKIWDELNMEESEAESREVYLPVLDDSTLRGEAAWFMQERWSNADYVSVMHVNIRTPDGRLYRFAVCTEQTVHFRAVPRATP